METKETVYSLITLAIGLLLLSGIVVGTTAIKDSQYSSSCANATHSANSSAVNCYEYTTASINVKNEFLNYTVVKNNTLIMNHTSVWKRELTCTNIKAMNASNNIAIPDSNWTEPNDCVIDRTTKSYLYAKTNWTVNYTGTFSNLTGTSTYIETPNSAYNLTRNVESMTNNFSNQLGTVGVMFGVALIIAGITVLGIGIIKNR